jgi:hypothetical protein
MPEAQHIDTAASIVHAIENQIRGTNEFLHSGATPDVAAAFRKLREALSLVEQRPSKPIRGL